MWAVGRPAAPPTCHQIISILGASLGCLTFRPESQNMPRVWLWSYFDFHHTEIISGPWACPHYIGPLMSCSPLLSSPDQARKSDQMTPVRPAAFPPLPSSLHTFIMKSPLKLYQQVAAVFSLFCDVSKPVALQVQHIYFP